MEFGRAYGALPAGQQELSHDQETFLYRAVAALIQDDAVIPVKLALLADMLKAKDWIPATLKGGFEQVGRMFLEETFGEKAPPQHRPYRKPAQRVLKALLPAGYANIKGTRQSREVLLTASGYSAQSRDFEELLRILDNETRLVTPVEDENEQLAGLAASSKTGCLRYYQLTHDYLVQPLASWLTEKQSQTLRGRAELRLANRSAAWNTMPDNRHLPTWWEYINIRMLTSRKKWSYREQRMMHRARQVHGFRAVVVIFFFGLTAMTGPAVMSYRVIGPLLAVVVIGAMSIVLAGISVVPFLLAAKLWEFFWYKRAQQATVLVQRLMFADADSIGTVLNQLRSYRRRAKRTLKMLANFEPATAPDLRARLLAQLALVERDDQYVQPLLTVLLTGHISSLGVIRHQLEKYANRLKDDLWNLLRDTSKIPSLRFRAGLALATYSRDPSEWKDSDFAFLAEQLVASNFEDQSRIRDYLRPLAERLINDLVRIHRDQSLPQASRSGAANALADYARLNTEQLADLMIEGTAALSRRAPT
jgi:hypothetical protein